MRAPAPSGFLPREACALERRALVDEELQAQLDEVGFVVVPLLDADGVARLVDGYDRLVAELGGSSNPEDYNDTFAEFSIIHSKPEFRRRAYGLITSELVPVVDRHLIDHRPLIANFVNKPPGTGVVPTHQNFSVVDETVHRSLSVWVALVDCTTHNGAMSMLAGSHRTLRGRRGMWAYQAFGGIPQDDLDPMLTPVEVPAGHAVILDDALVHYSPPNQTDARRLAIQFVVVPDEVPSLWFQQVGADDDDLDIAVWEVDERYFFEFWHGDGDARYAKAADQLTVPLAQLDLPTLRDLLDGGADAVDPPPADDAPADVEPATVDVATGPVTESPQRSRGLRALISRLSR